MRACVRVHVWNAHACVCMCVERVCVFVFVWCVYMRACMCSCLRMSVCQCTFSSEATSTPLLDNFYSCVRFLSYLANLDHRQ